jgi:catechol 2,3-dioxygenase-like lactoylglutathione lyase family enzyme
MANLTGLLEASLYVQDLARSIQFYRTVLELEVLVQDHRFCALNVAGRQVLLLFRKGGSIHDAVVPGGVIPGHDGDGQLHVAFAIPSADLPTWEQRLIANGVAVESKVDWARGGKSLYFRDPDNHVLELATPGVWSIY